MREGIRTYKGIRNEIRRALPYWPLGFARTLEADAALALDAGEKIYLAVWHRFPDNAECTEIPLGTVLHDRRPKSVGILYPSSRDMQNKTPYTWDDEQEVLRICFQDAPAARLFVLKL